VNEVTFFILFFIISTNKNNQTWWRMPIKYHLCFCSVIFLYKETNRSRCRNVGI
jgi:hypothetical protein